MTTHKPNAFVRRLADIAVQQGDKTFVLTELARFYPTVDEDALVVLLATDGIDPADVIMQLMELTARLFREVEKCPLDDARAIIKGSFFQWIATRELKPDGMVQ